MSKKNIFTEKKAVIEVLERLVDTLADLEKDARFDYRIVGKESEQAKDWRTGELKWDDEEKTIPHYDSKWDYVEIPKDELSDERLAKLVAIGFVRESLEKLA